MSPGGRNEIDRTIERVARESYGRLIAYLSAHTRDLASAEDALSEALVAALNTWQRDGVPHSPEAWLLTVARRSLFNVMRHQKVVSANESALLTLNESRFDPDGSSPFPDERLKLLFVCAHPAIDPAMHTPLMLQTVLGLDAARIAPAFLVSPSTMSQRLVRAKTKINYGGIPFRVPEERELPERLNTVLEGIYAAYGIGWDDLMGIDHRGKDLAEEALWLARVLLALMPEEPEARGLLALMLHCEARRRARRDSAGRYVPLSEQDPRLWSQAHLEEAEQHLAIAAKVLRPGRFQLEAAIQSVHAERAHSGRTEWPAIVFFYEQLMRIAPTLGTRASHAAAVAEASGPAAALQLLDVIDLKSVSAYQPYWAVRAHLLQQLGKPEEAHHAFERAIGLSEDPAVRNFLLEKLR